MRADEPGMEWSMALLYLQEGAQFGKENMSIAPLLSAVLV